MTQNRGTSTPDTPWRALLKGHSPRGSDHAFFLLVVQALSRGHPTVGSPLSSATSSRLAHSITDLDIYLVITMSPCPGPLPGPWFPGISRVLSTSCHQHEPLPLFSSPSSLLPQDLCTCSILHPISHSQALRTGGPAHGWATRSPL